MSNSFPAKDHLLAKAGGQRLVPVCCDAPGSMLVQSTGTTVLSGKSDEFHARREKRPVSGRAQHVGESLISDRYYIGP
ncbi:MULTISPECIES: hypothetical protein [Mesorhizobium]|uniref:hypothetical protein n=1 Tax=Mesorhizobium sp. TaxID=1871066 RepID=UPI000FE9A6F9|nr:MULTISPECIES: hypothetical protein [Mesorhizobium]RWL21688.1 MAG: hypothetical protein EOR57_04285 [Mesorhizobium sp.]RWM68020.1 MAG: hypothetical protein EOR82_25575 [Mesorhizobium sp.]TIO22108.1 MAG: hypothetical protein E5X83_26860 [Mesorhizobium sp.]TJV62060.1 MAG: hypothetical protein E5X82_06880 [Mesorhizobium sp.]